jgi:hypothetical protein
MASLGAASNSPHPVRGAEDFPQIISKIGNVRPTG